MRPFLKKLTNSEVFVCLVLLISFFCTSIYQLQSLRHDKCVPQDMTVKCTERVFDSTVWAESDWFKLEEKYDGDLVSYLKMGKAWIGESEMDSDMRWRFKNWPPLTPAFSGLSLLADPFISIGYFKSFFVCLLFSFVTMRLFFLFKLYCTNIFLSFLIVILPFLFPDFRQHTLGKGVFLSESITIAFLLLGIVYFFYWLIHKKNKHLFTLSIAWSLAILGRAQFEYILNASLFFVLLVLLVFYLANKSKSNFDVLIYKDFAVKICTILILIQVVLSPWKIRNYIVEKKYAIMTTSDSFYGLLWLPSSKAPYWLEKSNTACEIKPDLCQSIYLLSPTLDNNTLKILTYATLLKNYEQWFNTRFNNWKTFWIQKNFIPVSDETTLSNQDRNQIKKNQFWYELEFYVMFFLFLLGLYLSIKSKKNLTNNISLSIGLFFILGIIFTHLLLWLIIPPDPRYFILGRISGWLFFILALISVYTKKDISFFLNRKNL